MHYLDNAATTEVLPEVLDVIQQTMRGYWGNPSSKYAYGKSAEKIFNSAKEQIAKPFGLKAELKPEKYCVFFTGSGTQANNIAIFAAARARKAWARKIITTGYEHPSVAKPLEYLAKHEGFELTRIMPDMSGNVNAEEIVAAVDKETALVCVMHVNNEIGAILDVERIAKAAKEKNSRCFVHIDGIQAFGKLQITLNDSGIDSYAVGGHKLHAPKGIGALIMPNGKPQNFMPPILGGGQQEDVCPGTENVAFAAGFAKAVDIEYGNIDGNMACITLLKQKLLAGIRDMHEIRVVAPENSLANIVMLLMPQGLRSQVVLNALDEIGVCVSSGSACKGGELSPTLLAMGLPKSDVDTAIRVSFSAYNTEDDVQAVLCGLRDVLRKRARDMW